MISTQPYSDRIKAAAARLAEVDYVLIGAGAGLSAAAGLNYLDPKLFQQWYPQFAGLGLRTIWEGITAHWSPEDTNQRRFWAFWAHHIKTIRYEAPVGQVYLDLARLVANKRHFVITTNVDGQFEKAGFKAELLFTPQGDYGKFQCATPCCHQFYDNRSMVRQMLDHMDDQTLLIQEADLPHCPNCGGDLERNLRRDHHFVEAPYLERQPAYAEFVNRSCTGKLLLLEVGVGFNTPTIIRWPFERLALQHPQTALLRINLVDAGLPAGIDGKSIGFQEDAARVIRDLLTSQAGTCMSVPLLRGP